MAPDDQTRAIERAVKEREDSYSLPLILALLCLVASLEGADGALLPSTIVALEQSLGISIANMGKMALGQAFVQALSAPIWGILASRAIVDRKRILIIGCVMQGAVTVLLSCVTSFAMMVPLRMLNGMFLAALRPISYGIIADVCPVESQGKFFGCIMMSMICGGAVGTLVCTPLSRDVIEFAGLEFWGWQLAFVLVGGFSILLGPLLAATLSIPPVKTSGDSVSSVSDELRTLWSLLKMPTFAALVLQGCFGAIPWNAGNFRVAFFQMTGINDAESAIIGSIGGFAGAAGSLLGGVVGDCLARCNQIHGRIATAELTVSCGIPIAYFTYMVFPSQSLKFWYYLTLQVLLGLTASWAATGVNPPILCSISNQEQRSLVLAWCSALEGAVAASGNFWVGYLAEVAFGLDSSDPSQSGAEPLGKAMFWVHFVPWIICGLFYTTLHWAYPRDLARIAEKEQISLDAEKEKISELRSRRSTVSLLADASAMGIVKRSSVNNVGPNLLTRTSKLGLEAKEKAGDYGSI
jgi:MFS family permease